MHRIKFYYSIGDSFGSRGTSAELECVFQNLDITKEKLATNQGAWNLL